MPVRFETKAIFFPSGEYESRPSLIVPPVACVTCRSPAPSIPTVNTFPDVGGPKSVLKAACVPSGEQSSPSPSFSHGEMRCWRSARHRWASP